MAMEPERRLRLFEQDDQFVVADTGDEGLRGEMFEFETERQARGFAESIQRKSEQIPEEDPVILEDF